MPTYKEKVFVSMEEVFIVLYNLQQENQTLHVSIVHFQNNQASTSLGCVSTMQP
jgi:hypothetical protein